MENNFKNGTSGQTKDDIVISGISGRFPECENVDEFKEKLLQGVDLVTEGNERWPDGFLGLPSRLGKLKDLKRFDAEFFGVNAQQAHQMDLQQRILLETTFEAIVDAGVNPSEIRGSNTGVFVGAWLNESEDCCRRDFETLNQYSMISTGRCFLSNRLSFAFDFKGPGYTVDSACSSSLVALQNAVAAIRSGECDAAIVAGVNICLLPETSLELQAVNVLDAAGKCRAFDSSGNGYVRSEAIVVLYLQKISAARRVYASILGAKVNSDGYKQGVTNPSFEAQYALMSALYDNLDVNVNDVGYVEAHGTGTQIGDSQEANALTKLFCQNRKGPLLVGSVKSNMGHAEAASGLCSVAKAIVAMEHGMIPGNLHYESPNSNISAILDGRLKVVTQNEPWKGGLVAINSFGIGGTNAHVVLRPNVKSKLKPRESSIPRLVTVSGRTEDAVTHYLEEIEKHKDEPDLFSLLDKIHSTNITGHEFRGYSILDGATKEVTKITNLKRPIWFIYSGMGSQWCGMAKQIIELNAFKESIEGSAAILSEYGVDLKHLLINAKEEELEDTLNSFVCILAVQIALTDVFKHLGIEPDGIVGHSVGEIACAYADGALTSHQTIMVAYLRGRAISETHSAPYKMASVGLTWEECKKRCPPETFPACHNSFDNVTISGLAEPVEEFVRQLQSENIFAKVIKGVNKAFHTKFVSEASGNLLKPLEELIPNPKKRSSKWISTSVLETDWNSPLAQTCSAAYLVNNLNSPVFFYEALRRIPENAVTIEIAPHSLLQSILKRALDSSVSKVSLMKRHDSDNIKFILSNLGRLYNAGCQPNISKLYETASFPVGRGTPMIAPLIKWDHSGEWNVPSSLDQASTFGENVITIDIATEEYKFLSGHTVDGRIIFPGAGYLVLVWKTFAKQRHKNFDQMPVVIENVKFHRATIIPKKGVVKFLVNIFKGSGGFEVCESGAVVASGKISVPEKVDQEFGNLPSGADANGLSLSTHDVYKEFLLRGYEYSGLFKGILCSDMSGVDGEVEWTRNWTAHLDVVLQFVLVSDETRLLLLLTEIQRVVINPLLLSQTSKNNAIRVHHDRHLGLIKSGGIEIRGITNTFVERNHQLKSEPKLETYQFFPFRRNASSLLEALTITSHIVLENLGHLHKLELLELLGEDCLGSLLKTILELEPAVTVSYTVLNPSESHTTKLEPTEVCIIKKNVGDVVMDKNIDLVVLADALQNPRLLTNALAFFRQSAGFLLLEESKCDADEETFATLGLEIVSVQTVTATFKSYILLRKTIEDPSTPAILQIRGNSIEWLEPLKSAMQASETDNNTKIYLVAQGEQPSGIIGMVNCLRKEPGGGSIRAYFLQNQRAATFNLSTPFYAAQVAKDLVHNVLDHTNTWGTFRHLPLEPDVVQKDVEVEHAVLESTIRGDLSSLRWIQSPPPYHTLNKKEELCTIYYAPLNFRDVLLATGKLVLPPAIEHVDSLGLEFSGRDSAGKRVFGILLGGGLATTCLTDPELLVEVPEEWSLEQAATVPVVYATCYYGLIVQGKMRPGESVLIHAGAGGVGQAAISIALYMNCTVFTTVGGRNKRDFLIKAFPRLNANYIGNSRDTSFEQLVMTQTKGRGVDLVLNSLAGEQLMASVRCLATEGRFLEIGKIDMINGTLLSLGTFLQNRSFFGIDLHDVQRHNRPLLKKILGLVTQGIKDGAVKPLPSVVFPHNEVVQACKLMASGKQVGKILVKIQDEDCGPVPRPKTISAASRTYMDPYKTYIIAGGLGNVGLELTYWLVSRGAAKIVLTTRSGVRTGYQALCVRRWKAKGVNVVVSKCDAATLKNAQELVDKANTLGPVGGIFNLAMVLHDALIQNQTEESFAAVAESKICTTQNLDIASRKLTTLKYFVVFSSLSCARGNAGQANYGYANSAAERICESRRVNGLPGLAIQWGAIGDVGYFVDKSSEFAGVVPQRLFSCFNALDIFLNQAHAVVSSIVLAEKGAKDTKTAEIGIEDAIGHLLGIKDVKSALQTFSELGMDSLVGTEIKQTLERNYGVILNLQEIRALTFQRLKDIYARSVCDAPRAKNNQREVEIVPQDALVKLSRDPSKPSANSTFFLLPARESFGHLRNLARLVDAPMYALQYPRDCFKLSVNELALFYNNQLKTVARQEPYLILGRLFAARIAFEMGIQLENSHQTVKIVLLDDRIRNEGPSNNQIKILAYFASLYRELEASSMEKHLAGLESLDERIAYVAQNVPNSYGDVGTGASSFCDLFKASTDYKPSNRFKGSVTIVRAREGYDPQQSDLGLSLFCEQKISVVELDGNYETILQEPFVNQTARIIKNVIENL